MLKKRQILVAAALILYWSAIFIATHIPIIPRWAGLLPGSDKTLHFIAYLVLVFLLWFAINPESKVNWRRPAAWWLLLIVVWYGVIDEWLQMYVGRSADVRDFMADIAGALTGLAFLTIFNFRPACLILTGFGIFVMTNFFCANPAFEPHFVRLSFYFFSYAFFSLLWISYINHFLSLRPAEIKWLISSTAAPALLLLSFEVFCLIAGHNLNIPNFLAAFAGILTVVIPIFFYRFIWNKFLVSR